ncbi:hypothetical protein O181_081756 [Austropuccinia psidii MF-1]|uniref:Uncharacterized protein n=1 Tax=Austropuccinia psidii MF-1 TaxID=1389203 RepID=A0A9Q3FKU0_9BASI|nr:hypothetical protein [Austropuccinia psidii MF-1]
MLGKGCNSTLPADTLRKDLIEIHPKASSLKIILDKVKNHAKQSINDAFDYAKQSMKDAFDYAKQSMKDSFGYAKQKWYKSHKVPEFKVGDLGSFFIVALHGNNAVQVELIGELEKKHPTFPVSLIKRCQPADKELCPLRNPTPLTVPPVEHIEDKNIKKGELGVKIKENILSDIEIQYMEMNGWQNQKYLTLINS